MGLIGLNPTPNRDGHNIESSGSALSTFTCAVRVPWNERWRRAAVAEGQGRTGTPRCPSEPSCGVSLCWVRTMPASTRIIWSVAPPRQLRSCHCEMAFQNLAELPWSTAAAPGPCGEVWPCQQGWGRQAWEEPLGGAVLPVLGGFSLGWREALWERGKAGR